MECKCIAQLCGGPPGRRDAGTSPDQSRSDGTASVFHGARRSVNSEAREPRPRQSELEEIRVGSSRVADKAAPRVHHFKSAACQPPSCYNVNDNVGGRDESDRLAALQIIN